MENILLLTAAGTEASDPLSMLITFGPFVIVLVAMYFILIRPQRKKEKAVQDMRSKVEVGDSIVTIGGIVGFVISIKDDTVLIETGADKTKMRFKKWAINEVEKANEEKAS